MRRARDGGNTIPSHGDLGAPTSNASSSAFIALEQQQQQAGYQAGSFHPNQVMVPPAPRRHPLRESNHECGTRPRIERDHPSSYRRSNGVGIPSFIQIETGQHNITNVNGMYQEHHISQSSPGGHHLLTPPSEVIMKELTPSQKDRLLRQFLDLHRDNQMKPAARYYKSSTPVAKQYGLSKQDVSSLISMQSGILFSLKDHEKEKIIKSGSKDILDMVIEESKHDFNGHGIAQEQDNDLLERAKLLSLRQLEKESRLRTEDEVLLKSVKRDSLACVGEDSLSRQYLLEDQAKDSSLLACCSSSVEERLHIERAKRESLGIPSSIEIQGEGDVEESSYLAMSQAKPTPQVSQIDCKPMAAAHCQEESDDIASVSSDCKPRARDGTTGFATMDGGGFQMPQLASVSSDCKPRARDVTTRPATTEVFQMPQFDCGFRWL